MRAAIFCLLVALAAAGCRPGKPLVRVASPASPDCLIVAHMVAQICSADPMVEVSRKFDMADAAACIAAMREEEADVCPAYLLPLLTGVLKQPIMRDRENAYNHARDLLDARYGVLCLPPLGFSDNRVLVMRAEDARKRKIRKISDLRPQRDKLMAAFSGDFLAEPSGYPALRAAYGLSFAKPPRKMSQRSLYRSLERGDCDLISGFSTDPALASGAFCTLADDLFLFPPNEMCLLVRRKFLKRVPSLEFTLKKLSHMLDESRMRRLKSSVIEENTEPADAAAAFLKSRKLVR